MDTGLAWALLLSVLFAVILLPRLLRGLWQSSTLHISDDKFSFKGVSVDMDNGTIRLGGRDLPVASVTGLRWESESRKVGLLRTITNETVIISVNDMRRPVHKITLVGAGEGEKLVERLSLAIARAGGPQFS